MGFLILKGRHQLWHELLQPTCIGVLSAPFLKSNASGKGSGEVGGHVYMPHGDRGFE